VWRIAPPLTVSRADIDLAMTIFDRALAESKDALAQAASGVPPQRMASSAIDDPRGGLPPRG
jgi:hypothetical protein